MLLNAPWKPLNVKVLTLSLWRRESPIICALHTQTDGRRRTDTNLPKALPAHQILDTPVYGLVAFFVSILSLRAFYATWSPLSCVVSLGSRFLNWVPPVTISCTSNRMLQSSLTSYYIRVYVRACLPLPCTFPSVESCKWRRQRQLQLLPAPIDCPFLWPPSIAACLHE